jgi:ribosomal protein S18 acetylase RimI-like enzyme
VTVDIREATTNDVDVVLALWNTDADPGRTILDEPADVRRLLASPSGTLVVAEEDGELIGTLIAAWDGWRGNLYRLVVRADHRRKGVARRLVAKAEEVLRAKGCPRVTALVHLGLDEAPSFWPAVSYEHDAEVGRFVRNLD